MSTATATLAGVVGFTDLVGFTEYTAVRGDDEAVALLARQDAVVRSTLPDGGRVVKELGDGLLLFFAEPTDAVPACLTLRRELEAAGTGSDWPLWVRIGLHFGHPAVRGDDLVGHDVNVAARIVDVAAPGELLVSDDAREASGPIAGVEYVELGPVVMKGLPDAVPLYRVEVV